MRRKWIWVIGFWLLQAAVPYVVFVPALQGSWPSPSEWIRALTDLEYAAVTGGTLALMTLGQALFLLPVRKPGLAAGGAPLWLCLGVAGLVIGGMAGALVLSAFDVAWMVWRDRLDEVFEYRWSVLAVVAAGWAVATPLLVRFCRRDAPEALISRIAARLFLGTLVEAMAIIPLNVMMRRRDDCHCAHGTLWALIFCAGVGWFALGPALLVPLLARRRKRYAGHCGACGYDMQGCPGAGRCPECGAGWKPAPARS